MRQQHPVSDTQTRRQGKYLPKRKTLKKPWIFAGVVIVALAAAILIPKLLGQGGDMPILDLSDTTVLAYTDLKATISATGTVESAETTTVYSTAAYPVMAVYAEVGDYVEEGQLLAELDDTAIQNQITSQEINLQSVLDTGAQQVANAQSVYDNYKSGLDQGLNASLNSARTQADTAYDNYLKAKTNYERYRESINVGENTALLQAEASLRNARNAMEAAVDAYYTAVDTADAADRAAAEAEAPLLEALQQLDQLQTELTAAETVLVALKQEKENLEQLSDRTEAENARLEALPQEILCTEAELLEQNARKALLLLELSSLQSAVEETAVLQAQAEQALAQTEQALEQTQETYDLQAASYNAAMTTVDNTLADYHTNMESAWKAYQTALTSLASTEKTVQDQLQTYQSNLQNAQANADNPAAEENLRQLRENLEDACVTAPCAGTVTAVYAEVGKTGTGLLFVIENVDELVVSTSVKGYDVGTVREGMQVLIRSDATGDRRFDGVVNRIAPTSTKNAMGLTDTTREAVFAAEVAVTDRDTGLRIGMEAQLDYIITEADHVLAVPYDAVYERADGKTCVLAALEQDDGTYLIRELEVTTGMDDDLDLVISGPEIREGLRIIHTPDVYRDLVGQIAKEGTIEAASMFDQMSAMMG